MTNALPTPGVGGGTETFFEQLPSADRAFIAESIARAARLSSEDRHTWLRTAPQSVLMDTILGSCVNVGPFSMYQERDRLSVCSAFSEVLWSLEEPEAIRCLLLVASVIADFSQVNSSDPAINRGLVDFINTLVVPTAQVRRPGRPARSYYDGVQYVYSRIGYVPGKLGTPRDMNAMFPSRTELFLGRLAGEYALQRAATKLQG